MKFLIVSLLSNLTLLFANSLTNSNQQPIFPPLIWLVTSLGLILILFWSFYKTLKTKNPKYGYLMAVIVLLLGGMLFI